MSKVIGYARVSSYNQLSSLHDQFAALKEKGGCSYIYGDIRSGVSKYLPGRKDMLQDLEMGDTLVVCHIDRLTRDLLTFLEIICALTRKNCSLEVIKQPIHSFTSPIRTDQLLMLIVMAFAADKQREVIVEKGEQNRRPIDFDGCLALWERGCSLTTITTHFGYKRNQYKRLVLLLEEAGMMTPIVPKGVKKLQYEFYGRKRSRHQVRKQT